MFPIYFYSSRVLCGIKFYVSLNHEKLTLSTKLLSADVLKRFEEASKYICIFYHL